MSLPSRFAPVLIACLSWQTAATQSPFFTSSNLPIILINTNGQEILNEPKITASMSVIDNGPGARNFLTDPPGGYNGNIGIELHGSSSLWYDKKNYGIELRNLNGSDTEYPMLGMPEESDWLLISPLNDKTLMRDVIAHTFARAALDWSPRSRYCEVMLNGNYLGVYALIEKIKRGNDRVDIKKLSEKDTTGEGLTGGYMLRIDKNDLGDVGGDWRSNYPSSPYSTTTTWFQFFYPKPEDIHPRQAAYIKTHIRAFEDMMHGPNMGKEYPKWLDTKSWVDYLLVNELTKNTDGYRLSAYFYKDRDSINPLIKMGPVWDFNISFGIGDYCDGESWAGWARDFNNICPDDSWQIHFWWETLWQQPSFRKAIVLRWQELREGPWADDKLNGVIDSLSDLLQESQVRNFQRWPVIGTYVWPNSYIGHSYGDEVRFLENWLKNRVAWIDYQMESLYVPPPVSPGVEVYPNPARDYVDIKIGEANTKAVGVNVRLYAISGQLVFEKKVRSQFGLLHLDLPFAEISPGLYVARISAYNLPAKTMKICIVP